jgi:hypothetical protein
MRNITQAEAVQMLDVMRDIFELLRDVYLENEVTVLNWDRESDKIDRRLIELHQQVTL